ncbi:DUF2786 domain-containing protein [Micromonospora sp. NPDC048839]|uniref:DUF2786 domain-containing protein n=1 Tax=Micromonospora sp. NPDC048839 TaxID=3155641 RepID=UPI0033E1CFEA
MTAPDSKLATIRALLAKAESSQFPAEAEALTAKATELIGRYGVDRAMLAACDPTIDVPADKVVIVEGSYAIDKRDLLSCVAQALGVRVVFPSRGRTRSRHPVHLFGYASDLERVDMLFTSLLVQSANALAKAEIPWWEKAITFRKAWLAGFRQTISYRLQAAEARAKQEGAEERAGTAGPSVALVLADRATVVKTRMERAYPKLGKEKHRPVASGDGYTSGRAAGERADLGGTRIDRQRQALAH